LQGICDIFQLPADAPLNACIESVKMGTTVGANALLERKDETTFIQLPGASPAARQGTP